MDYIRTRAPVHPEIPVSAKASHARRGVSHQQLLRQACVKAQPRQSPGNCILKPQVAIPLPTHLAKNTRPPTGVRRHVKQRQLLSTAGGCKFGAFLRTFQWLLHPAGQVCAVTQHSHTKAQVRSPAQHCSQEHTPIMQKENKPEVCQGPNADTVPFT